MHTARPTERLRPGHTLIDLLTSLAALAIMAILLFPAISNSRRLASLGQSTNNLRWQFQCNAQYINDHQDKFAEFNWTKGNCPSSYPDLQFAADDVIATANQMVDIVRRRFNPSFPIPSNFIPHFNHQWLILADYQDMRIPARVFASPEDTRLLTFQTDPNNWSALGAPSARAPFWSSYAGLSTSFFDKGPINSRISQNSVYNVYLVPADASLGQKLLSEVAFPSQKVMSWDKLQRHFGTRVAYYSYPEVRLPMLFVDGAVAVRKTGDANLSWNPNSTSKVETTSYSYNANNGYDPPPLYNSSDFLTARYDWTRNYLAGRDFDGPAVK